MDGDWAAGGHEKFLIRIDETEVRESSNDSLHRDSRFESCQMGSQAKMNTESKGEMAQMPMGGI